ncbi:hypothetical protein ACIP6X_29465 [Streptomyces coeruleorubidus]|uniref:hypothetical protein n=1 Tax=Streptomyces coeruleorubidus TaxID=116188 RepID=UPI0037FBD1FC
MCPEEVGGGAGGGFVAERAGALVQAQERGEDRGRVVVVDATLVALVVRRLRRLPDEGGQVALRERGRAVFVQQAGGEVLGTVDTGRLGRQRTVPVGAGPCAARAARPVR